MKRLFIALTLIAISALNSDAQVLRQKMTLMNVTNQSSSVNGNIFELPITATSFNCRAIADANSGTPTLDAKIQYCFSKTDASTCKDLCVFDQCTTGACWTTGSQVIHINEATTNLSPFVRAVATLGGTSPNYDITIELWMK